MQFLFIDYTNLVLKAYEDSRNTNRLSRLLMHPTTANIRQECLNVFKERIKKAEIEEDILRAFFGVPPAGRNFDYVIERFHADKFRPLRSLIKREIKNPSLVNVELLAWLIDFNPRPLAFAQTILGTMNAPPDTEDHVKSAAENQPANIPGIKEAKVPSEDDGLPDKEKNGENVENEPAEEIIENKRKVSVRFNADRKRKEWTLRAVIFFLMLVISTVGLYAIWLQSRGQQTIMGSTGSGCMYWANDHYVLVPCNEPANGRLILPLNKEKMTNFKRIMREDTITEKSVGVIYYIRTGGTREYYTAAGNHPVNVTHQLIVLSQYMYDKYLHHQDSTDKEALLNKQGINHYQSPTP